MGRDPLDTKLVALQEQAVHLRAQLRNIDNAREALTRLSADADQLIADLQAAEEAALAAWVARDHAVVDQLLASRRSGKLLGEVAAWSRLVRRCLRWVDAPRPVARVRALLPLRFDRFAPVPGKIREAVAALTQLAPDLGVPERFDPLRTQGADLVARLDAHALDIARAADRAANTAAQVLVARAALLARCREVRAAWAAARVVDPYVPPLDLRIVRAEAAVSRRKSPKGPAPSDVQPPDDTDGSIPATPCDPDPSGHEETVVVRVTRAVEIVEGVVPDEPASPLDGGTPPTGPGGQAAG